MSAADSKVSDEDEIGVVMHDEVEVVVLKFFRFYNF
jgi:hypothetical protein